MPRLLFRLCLLFPLDQVREKREVFTMKVKLKPGWSYSFGLNGGKYRAFRSADGIPLKPIRVRFKTRPSGR